jgi:hypothetical protein
MNVLNWLGRRGMLAALPFIACIGVVSGIDTREPAPRFVAKTLDGERFTNEALKGRVVLLQFWATWRRYCRADQQAVDSIAGVSARAPGQPDGRHRSGARVELRVGIFRWVALHTAYERDRLFVDEQLQGPFAKWIHRHEFKELGVKTRLTDRIEYALPGGSFVNMLFGWVVNLGLVNMLAHRHRVTREVCERP